MSTSTESQRPVADLTYEQARDELVRVVARLEGGAETLEDSLALWERGEALAARCQEWLDGARRRLDEARGGASGASDSDGHDGHADDDDGAAARARRTHDEEDA